MLPLRCWRRRSGGRRPWGAGTRCLAPAAPCRPPDRSGRQDQDGRRHRASVTGWVRHGGVGTCLRRHSLSVELNHTIVHARDNRDSAEFFAKLLGLDITAEWGPFIAVGLSNGVTLDFATIPADSITPQHDFARYPVKQETCRDAVELASTLLPTVPGVTRAVVLVTDTVSCTCGGLCSPVSSRFRRLPWCSAVMTDTACGAGHTVWARCSTRKNAWSGFMPSPVAGPGLSTGRTGSTPDSVTPTGSCASWPACSRTSPRPAPSSRRRVCNRMPRSPRATGRWTSSSRAARPTRKTL